LRVAFPSDEEATKRPITRHTAKSDAFWAVALIVQFLLGDGAFALKRARA
jgi:hypothetical protein